MKECLDYMCNHTAEDYGVCPMVCLCGGTAVEAWGKCEGSDC